MVHLLTTLGTVTVVPAATAADEVLALEPDGVFLSNGPGDPAALPGPDRRRGRPGGPGAGLRHLPRPPDPGPALGGATYKLPFGHHGANHPVQRLETGVVEITSQNHNYAVAAGSVPDAETTHVNLNDGVIEGFRSLPGARLLGAVPPRGRSGAPRRPLPLRRLPRPHARPSRPGPPAPGRAERGEDARAAPRRPAVDPRHRVGPDRDRPGLRVRLLGHAGLPGPGRGGLPGRSWPTPTRPRS